jgi:hypothetical protein
VKFAHTLSHFLSLYFWPGNSGSGANEKYVFTRSAAQFFFFLGTNFKIVNNKAHHVTALSLVKTWLKYECLSRLVSNAWYIQYRNIEPLNIETILWYQEDETILNNKKKNCCSVNFSQLYLLVRYEHDVLVGPLNWWLTVDLYFNKNLSLNRRVWPEITK